MVLTKPSAHGTRGWLAIGPAALLCALMIVGCTSSGPTAATSAKPRDTVRSASSASPPAAACSPWTGLTNLFNITSSLRQMIGDEVIFGSGTPQAKTDGLAVVVYAQSLDGTWVGLPPQYAHDLRNSILPVAASPYKQTPEQLNAAANDAQRLAMNISRLCSG